MPTIRVGEPFQSTTIGAQLWHPNSSGRPPASTTAEAVPHTGGVGSADVVDQDHAGADVRFLREPVELAVGGEELAVRADQQLQETVAVPSRTRTTSTGRWT